MIDARRRAALCLAAAFSGGAALLNQILWTRLLGLVFGSTVEAVAAVTAVFMGGLALGSALGPRLLGRSDSAAARRLFARVELALAGAALGLAFLLPLLEGVRAAAGAGVAWPLATVALVVPTTLMGTTLVIASRALASGKEAREDARGAGMLFGANTLGAVAGVYGSVLWLLPGLGVRGTIALASALNVCAAALALSARERAVVPPESVRETASPRTPSAHGAPSAGVVLAALFVAGFAGLASEVAWTRAFVLVAGPTAHAFAFVLGAIVVGLAAGALVASLALPRGQWVPLGLGLAQLGVALASVRVLHVLAALPVVYGESVRRLADDPAAVLRLQGEGALALLALPALFSGMLFPLGVALLRKSHDIARCVSRASLTNTLGAIAGALAAGFVMLPALGLEATLRLSAGASALAGTAVLFATTGAARRVGLVAALAAGIAIHRTPPLDDELLAGGAYKYSVYNASVSVEEVLRRGELVFYVEGRLANVSVKRVGAVFSLAIDGKVDATSGEDMSTQRLLAHVPLLVHPRPRSALVIGLGSGVTAGSALTHALESVTAVEILPEVVEAARRFFMDANGHVLEDPRLRLIVGDARLHVLAAPPAARYDVVISEPSNPWMAGVSPLFTREFFARVRGRLLPGGIFCQWAHLYNMSEADLATLLAGFRDVFPDATAFVISEGDILLLGGEGALAFAGERLARVSPAAAADLRASRLSLDGLRAIPTVRLAELSAWLDPARRHTDDRPILEFRAPRAMHAQTAAAHRRRLLPGETPPLGAILVERVVFLDAAGSAEWAFDLAFRAVSEGSSDPSLLASLTRNAVRLGRTRDVEALLRPAPDENVAPDRRLALARLYWESSRPQEALAVLEEAAAAEPRFAPSFHLAAEIQSAAGNLQAMRQLLARAFAIDRRDAIALGLAAEAELKDGRFEPATRLANAALQADERQARALEALALALAQSGRRAEARRAFERLLAAHPDSDSAHANFGLFELEAGHAAQALRLFKDAVALNPWNRLATEGLREAATRLGDEDWLRLADLGLSRLR